MLEALLDLLRDQVFPPINRAEGWRTIAERFWTKWHFLHCLGAINGKHVRVKKPALSVALYHNYKGYFSIPLLAVADADYRFLWVNVKGCGTYVELSHFPAI